MSEHGMRGALRAGTIFTTVPDKDGKRVGHGLDRDSHHARHPTRPLNP